MQNKLSTLKGLWKNLLKGYFAECSKIGFYVLLSYLLIPTGWAQTGSPGTVKATPVITWATPAAITYGTALGSAQLNATSSVAGTFAYSPAAGTVLGAGQHTLTATFTPADPQAYQAVSASVTLTVHKANLLVRANDHTRPYGAADPAFTAKFLGMTNIVVLGSSTAAGVGASQPSNAWVNLLANQLSADYPGIIKITNLAQSGYTTFHILPTGTNNGNRPAVDPARNITAALALNPQLIIISMVSNDAASGFSDTETFTNFATVVNLARAAGVKVLLMGTQPRGDISNIATRQRLQSQNQTLMSLYGSDLINTYDELVDLATFGIKAQYGVDDRIHLNNAGHAYIYSQVLPAVRAWIETSNDGFVNNDTVDSLNGTLSFTTTATQTSPVGTYTITPSGLTSPNYNLTYSNGTLTIIKATATVTLTNLTQTYDGSAKAATVTTDPAGLPVSVTYNGSATLPTLVGAYDVVATVDHPNYSGSASGKLQIEDVILSSAVIKGPEGSLDPQQIPGLVVSAQPNPFTDRTVIYLFSKRSEPVLIELYDLRGAFIGQIFAGQTKGGAELKVELSGQDLSNGVYVLRLTVGAQMAHKRVLVAR